MVTGKNPLAWAFEPIRRFADFDGRSRRQEYWWFFLAQILMHIAFGTVVFSGVEAGNGGDMSDAQVIAAFVWLVACIGLIIPNLAVIVRRCHDIEIPAWIGVGCYIGMLLLGFLGFVILVLMLIPGKRYDNVFGPDPKGSRVGDIFA